MPFEYSGKSKYRVMLLEIASFGRKVLLITEWRAPLEKVTTDLLLKVKANQRSQWRK